MSTIDNFMIEVALKKKRVSKIPAWFDAISKEFKQYESDERLVLDIPNDWAGFKDGTVVNMLKAFGDGIYLALAYISDNDDIVVDFEGKPVDKYSIVINGVQKTKYIKKKLRIVKILDKMSMIFTVQDYLLNLEYLDSIIKVLDVYCVGSSSKFKVSDFVSEEAYS